MRDPVTRVDPETEAAIEETCQFLKSYMQDEHWKADPYSGFPEARATIDEVERSNLPDWAKNSAILALLRAEQTKKHRRKPTRKYRNSALEWAAVRLVDRRGYKPTRNETTRHRESAASIIRQALRLLGEKKLTEKQINDIVHEARDIARDIALIRDKFGYDVLK